MKKIKIKKEVLFLFKNKKCSDRSQKTDPTTETITWTTWD